jgi:hypothetical protein
MVGARATPDVLAPTFKNSFSKNIITPFKVKEEKRGLNGATKDVKELLAKRGIE